MIVAGSVVTKVNEQVVLFSVVGGALLLLCAASICFVLKKIVPFFRMKAGTRGSASSTACLALWLRPTVRNHQSLR